MLNFMFKCWLAMGCGPQWSRTALSREKAQMAANCSQPTRNFCTGESWCVPSFGGDLTFLFEMQHPGLVKALIATAMPRRAMSVRSVRSHRTHVMVVWSMIGRPIGPSVLCNAIKGPPKGIRHHKAFCKTAADCKKVLPGFCVVSVLRVWSTWNVLFSSLASF